MVEASDQIRIRRLNNSRENERVDLGSLGDGIHPRAVHGSFGVTLFVGRFLRIVLTDTRGGDSCRVSSPRELRDAVEDGKEEASQSR